MNVLIAGGSGMVGRELVKLLEKQSHEVAILTRKKHIANYRTFQWNVAEKTIDHKAIEFADAVINLAGANIADKFWTKKYKATILNSRVQSNELLFDAVKNTNKKLSAFISASAIGYYGGVTQLAPFVEDDKAGTDFLASTCYEWEKSADLFNSLDIRTVKLRLGVVLSTQGGMLKKVLPIFRKNMGSPMGKGNQFISWIHIADVANIFLHALQNHNIKGVYNAVAPQQITNKKFTQTLNKVLNKRQILPNVPAIILKLTHGEASTLMLDGSPISAQKIMQAKYNFQYPSLKEALENLIKNK